MINIQTHRQRTAAENEKSLQAIPSAMHTISRNASLGDM